MKLCKDCRHFGHSPLGLANCYHPKNLDLVDRSPKQIPIILRESSFIGDSLCGPEAKLFEPKPPSKSIWQWIKGVLK